MAKTPVPDRIGPSFEQLKLESGLTFEEVARRMDSLPGRASDLVREAANPTWETVAKFLNALDMSLWDLAAVAQPDLAPKSAPRSLKQNIAALRALSDQLWKDVGPT